MYLWQIIFTSARRKVQPMRNRGKTSARRKDFSKHDWCESVSTGMHAMIESSVCQRKQMQITVRWCDLWWWLWTPDRKGHHPPLLPKKTWHGTCPAKYCPDFAFLQSSMVNSKFKCFSRTFHIICIGQSTYLSCIHWPIQQQRQMHRFIYPPGVVW